MATGTPRKDDIVVKEKSDGSWSVFQDKTERTPLAGGGGIHLIDRDKVQETAEDIASYEKVDLWIFENGQYSLVKSFRKSA